MKALMKEHWSRINGGLNFEAPPIESPAHNPLSITGGGGGNSLSGIQFVVNVSIPITDHISATTVVAGTTANPLQYIVPGIGAHFNFN